jgi:vacuolar-type H+-ATPase subunit I/STV1
MTQANWAHSVVTFIGAAILITCLAIGLWALVHCALQRNDAFSAIGTLSKMLWLAIIAGSMLLGMVLWSLGEFFTLISLTASLVYLLDIRPALRDITSGGSNW